MLLALQLALGHRGRNLGHLGGVMVGLALAAMLLACAVAADNAAVAQARLKLQRDGVLDDLGHGEASEAAKSVRDALIGTVLLTDTDRGLLTVTSVAAVGDPNLGPPGLQAAPQPGEVLVSPAFGRALSSPAGPVLAGWLPGKPTGVLPPESLTGPRELVALVGADPSELHSSGQARVLLPQVDGARNYERNRLGLLLAVLAVLVPVGSLVAVSVRLSATRRDHRNATLRLVGASPGQVRLVLMVEAFGAAVVGTALGLSMFALARRLTSTVSVGTLDYYTRDLRLSAGQNALILAFVVAVAGAVTAVVSHRLALRPLTIRRQSRPLALSWTRALWMVAGTLLLLAEAGMARAGAPDGALYSVLVVGLGALVVGVVRWTPWVIRVVASGRGWTPAGSVAAARLRFNPTVGYRVVVGLALGAFAFGYVQVVGPRAAAGGTVESHSDLIVDLRGEESSDEAMRAISAVPGVGDVAGVSSEVAEIGDSKPGPFSVGSCAEMLRQLRVVVTAGGCSTSGEGALLPSGLAEELNIHVGDSVPVVRYGISHLTEPSDQSRENAMVTGVYTSEFEDMLGVLYSPPSGSVSSAQRIYVDAQNPETQRAVIRALTQVAPLATAGTPAMRQAAANVSAANFQQVINLLLATGTVIGLVAFAYGLFGMLVERRDVLTVLHAIGMGRAGLVNLLSVELVIPLFAAVGISLSVGIAAGMAQGAVLGSGKLQSAAVIGYLTVVSAVSALALVVLIVIGRSLPRSRPVQE